MNTIFATCATLIFFAISVSEVKGKKIIDISRQSNPNLFQGDILISPQQARNGVLKSRSWPNAIVPYEHGENWTEAQLYMIHTAMNAIQAYTCVKFVPRTDEKNYIITKNTSLGCFSDGVGMKGGPQIVSYMDTEWFGSCFVHRVVIHELLHAVGLWHEHARFDRDEYVTIVWDNVQNTTKAHHNFKLVPAGTSYTYGIPYNYKSVMHYNKFAFCNEDAQNVTIETRDPKFQDVIGTSEYADELDFEKIRRIYNCKGSYTPATAPPTTTEDPTICKDLFAAMCESFKEECANEEWMVTSCRKSCGLC